MKKFSILAAVALAAILWSCGNGAPKANLKDDVDTLTYAVGVAQTRGLKEYMTQRMNVDTTYMDEFFKGLKEGANAGDNKKKAAYYAGIQMGQQIAQQWVPGLIYEIFGEDSTRTVSLQNLLAGFISGTAGKNGLMTFEQAGVLAQKKMEAIKSESLMAQYGKNKEAGEKFLAENGKKEGVKTLPSGLQYKVIKEGNGAIPADSMKVKVNYEGKTIDGEVFDSSYKRGEALEMMIRQNIPGFAEALTHMPVGSTWEVYIPAELAYGEREMGQIKPYSTLIFKIELLDIVK